MNNILILKRSAFGDIIHTLPVIPALRSKFPKTVITWVTEVGFGEFLRTHEGIDRVVEIGFRSMFRRGWLGKYRRRMKSIRSERFDVLIDFQGTLKSWLLLRSAKAERKIGFNRLDAREPFTTRFYTEQVPPMPYGLHVIKQYLRLLEPLGITEREIRYPRMHLDISDEEYVEHWMAEQGNGKIVAVNPFTNWMTKNWPQQNVVDFCRLLGNETNYRPLILWGPPEKTSAEKIVSESDGAALLAPATTLTQLAALLQRCVLYLGGDTGPTHLATALRVPVVALFGPTDPRRNGPLDPADKTLWLEMTCKGCRRNRCKLNDSVAECMLQISPQMALEAMVRRLA